MRKLLLGKNLCACGFCSRNSWWRIYWYLSRHRIGNFSFATVPDYTQLKNKKHLILSSVFSAYRYPVHSSGRESAWASHIPPASSSLSIDLKPVRLLPIAPCVIAVMHGSNWISSRGKGIATCDFCPIQSNQDALPRTMIHNYLVFRSSTVDFLNYSRTQHFSCLVPGFSFLGCKVYRLVTCQPSNSQTFFQ